jgi:hypothetical protein
LIECTRRPIIWRPMKTLESDQVSLKLLHLSSTLEGFGIST